MAELYNGWKNRETWNVMLYINNDESLYRGAVSFMESYKGRKPYRDYVREMGLGGDKTPDGIAWIGSSLDYRALNNSMRAFA